MKLFPVVIILGVRQCGKSTLAKMLRPNWKYFDLENYQDYALLDEDPILFFQENPKDIIIDEAQKSPRLFETLRGIIDQGRREKGRFLLTGSGSFELMKQVSESLAGRAAVVELGVFKFSEFHSKPLPHFYEIFLQKISRNSLSFLKSLKPTDTFMEQKDFFLKGGFPEPGLAKEKGFGPIWMENYFNTYINRDMRALFPKLDLIKYRRIISILSSVSGTIINKAEIARTIEVSERTVRDYLDIIQGTFFWRSLASYRTAKIKTTSKLPKGQFVDSGLTFYLQNIQSHDDLNRLPQLGRYFESYIVEEIIKGIECTNVVNLEYFHLRTKAGGEIDLVLSGPFGLIPIEVKFGSVIQRKKIQFLVNFVEDHKLPLGIVINNSDKVHLIHDKIIQIPATLI